MQSPFHDELVDHFKYPRNKGTLENPDFVAGRDNPSCGDRISFSGTLNNGVIADIKFDGTGCVISQATASMLTEVVVGKTPEHLQALTKDFIIELIGMDLGPTRLKCALLSLDVLHEAMQDVHQSTQKNNKPT